MIRRTKGFFFLERFLWIFYHSNQTNNNSGNISPCPACNIQANGFFIFHSSCCWPRDGHCCFFSALSTFSLCSISGRQNYKGSPEGNDDRNRRRFDWGVKKNRRWICGFLRWKYQKGTMDHHSQMNTKGKNIVLMWKKRTISMRQKVDERPKHEKTPPCARLSPHYVAAEFRKASSCRSLAL